MEGGDAFGQPVSRGLEPRAGVVSDQAGETLEALCSEP